MMLKTIIRSTIIYFSNKIRLDKIIIIKLTTFVALLTVYQLNCQSVQSTENFIPPSTENFFHPKLPKPLYAVDLYRRFRRNRLLPNGSYQVMSAEGRKNQSKIVTIHHFLSRDHMYLIDNKDRCGSHKELHFIIVIYSVPGSFREREIIRQKLLSQITPDMSVTFVFLLGLPGESGSNYAPLMTHKEENYITGDIVQGNFIDSYKNLTLKSATMIHWIKNYCSNSKFVLKMDSDVDFDISGIQKLLEPYGTPRTQYAVCNSVRFTAPTRIKKSKYYVDISTYVKKIYPHFCKGPAYFLTVNAVVDMWHATFSLEFFHLEDVYLTGFVRGMIGMDLRRPQTGRKLFCGAEEFGTNISCSLMHRKSLTTHNNVTTSFKTIS